MVNVEKDEIMNEKKKVINEKDIVVRINIKVDEQKIYNIGGEIEVKMNYEGELNVKEWRVKKEGKIEIIKDE
jgi:hypothetical protein